MRCHDVVFVFHKYYHSTVCVVRGYVIVCDMCECVIVHCVPNIIPAPWHYCANYDCTPPIPEQSNVFDFFGVNFTGPISVSPPNPPDPKYVRWICRKYFTYRSVQYRYLKSCSGDFYSPESILRTRSLVTGFITQYGWVFHFHLTESVRWKCFILAV